MRHDVVILMYNILNLYFQQSLFPDLRVKVRHKMVNLMYSWYFCFILLMIHDCVKRRTIQVNKTSSNNCSSPVLLLLQLLKQLLCCLGQLPGEARSTVEPADGSTVDSGFKDIGYKDASVIRTVFPGHEGVLISGVHCT